MVDSRTMHYGNLDSRKNYIKPIKNIRPKDLDEIEEESDE